MNSGEEDVFVLVDVVCRRWVVDSSLFIQSREEIILSSLEALTGGRWEVP